MKKHLLKICAIGLFAIVNTSVFAQQNVDVAFTTGKPIIDGQIDALWDTIAKQEIVTAYASEEVSFSASATWQAVWDNEQVYILVSVPDDNFYTGEENGSSSWLADKVELFFDVNDRIKDGGGPSSDNGHYQIAPPFYDANEDPYAKHEFGFTIFNNSSYICEYAVPFSSLINKKNETINPYLKETIGFDITLIDLDEFGKGESTSRERVNWNSDASLGESWSNMDNCGTITFVGGDDCGIPDTTYLATVLDIGETYIFNDEVLTESGIYYAYLKNEAGCDSIIQIDLTIPNTRHYKAKQIKLKNKPIIDGEIDPVWSIVPAQKIAVQHKSESTSMDADPTFKAIWDQDSIYILVDVPDDDFYPGNEAGVASWQADKVEIYFDVNKVIEDRVGPASGSGHHQIAADISSDELETDFEYDYAYTINSDSSNYRFEYAIPVRGLTNTEGASLNPLSQEIIGFDITIIDLDEAGKGLNTIGRGRLNWQNDGSINESWNNMDYCGRLVFEQGEICSKADSTLAELTICSGDSVVLGSQTIFASGSYSEVFYTTDGCDSTVSVTVTVNEHISTTVEQNGLTLTASQSDATYQWVKCGTTQEPIDGATEQTFTATENGDYAVIISKDNCSETSECVDIAGVGVNDFIALDAIHLFPNPVDNILNITINKKFNEVTVNIYNSVGQIILTKANITSDKISISTQDLTQGIYLVNIQIENQNLNYQIVK